MNEYDVIIQFTEEVITVNAESKKEATSLAMEEIAEYMRQGNLSFHVTSILSAN